MDNRVNKNIGFKDPITDSQVFMCPHCCRIVDNVFTIGPMTGGSISEKGHKYSIAYIKPIFNVYCNDCNDYMVEIDRSIVDKVVMLNKKGYPTIYSCSGHYDRKTRNMSAPSGKTVYENPYIIVVLDNDAANIAEQKMYDFFKDLNPHCIPRTCSRYRFEKEENTTDYPLEDGEAVYRISMDIVFDDEGNGPSEISFIECINTWEAMLATIAHALPDKNEMNKMTYKTSDVIDLFCERYGYDDCECDEGFYARSIRPVVKVKMTMKDLPEALATITKFCNENNSVMEVDPYVGAFAKYTGMEIRFLPNIAMPSTDKEFNLIVKEWINTVYTWFYKEWEDDAKHQIDILKHNNDEKFKNAAETMMNEAIKKIRRNDVDYEIISYVKGSNRESFSILPSIVISFNKNHYAKVIKNIRNSIDHYKANDSVIIGSRDGLSKTIMTLHTKEDSNNTYEDIFKFWDEVDFIAGNLQCLDEYNEYHQMEISDTNKIDDYEITDENVMTESKPNPFCSRVVETFEAITGIKLMGTSLYDLKSKTIDIIDSTACLICNTFNSSVKSLDRGIIAIDDEFITNPTIILRKTKLTEMLLKNIREHAISITVVDNKTQFKLIGKAGIVIDDKEFNTYMRKELNYTEEATAIFRVALFWSEVMEMAKRSINAQK